MAMEAEENGEKFQSQSFSYLDLMSLFCYKHPVFSHSNRSLGPYGLELYTKCFWNAVENGGEMVIKGTIIKGTI